MDAWVSNEKRASTSVETLPGIILRISFPNSTSSRSNAWSTCESMSLPYSNYLVCLISDEIYPSAATTSLEGTYLATHLLLPILNCHVDQLGVLGLLRRGKNKGWVGSGVLGFVLSDSLRLSDNTRELWEPSDVCRGSLWKGKVLAKSPTTGQLDVQGNTSLGVRNGEISPESQTTVYFQEYYRQRLSCSRKVCDILIWDQIGSIKGRRGSTYRACSLQLL